MSNVSSARFCSLTGKYVKIAIASATCAFANVRKLGLLSRLTSAHSLSGKLNQSAESVWIVKLPQKTFVFLCEARGRHRHLANQPLKFGENRRINLDPFARDLKQHVGKQVIENVFAAVHHLQPLAQNALEVVGRNEIGERMEGAWIRAEFTKAVTAAWI